MNLLLLSTVSRSGRFFAWSDLTLVYLINNIYLDPMSHNQIFIILLFILLRNLLVFEIERYFLKYTNSLLLQKNLNVPCYTPQFKL